MADRYWVGGSGDWSDTSHWSNANGGLAGASVPGPADVANVFAGGGAVVNMDLDVDVGFLFLRALNSSGMSVVSNGHTITSVNLGMSGTVSFPITFDLRNSIVNIVNRSGFLAISPISFPSNALWTVLTSGSSVRVDLTGQTGSLNTLNFGGRTFDEVRLVSPTAPLQIAGSNTISDLSISGATQVRFAAGATQTLGTFQASGSSVSQIVLRSSVSGSSFTLNKATGIVDLLYVDIKDSVATGGATWNAHNSLDSGGNSGWSFIGPAVPSADFSASPSTGRAPLSVVFADLTIGVPDTWLWTFGDGSTSTLQNPTHVYAAPGVYSVSLYASNSLGGDTEVKTSFITAVPTIIGPTEIPSAEAFSDVNVQPGTTLISIGSVLPDEAFSDVSFSITVPSVGGIATAEAFGVPAIITGVKNFFPDEIASQEAFGVPNVQPGTSFVPILSSGDGEVMDEPIVVAGGVTVSGLGDIATAEAVSSPVITQTPPPPPPPTDWAAIGKEDEKEYIYRVYQSDGTFIGIWTDVLDELEFSQPINSAGTTTTVRLARSPSTTKEVRASLVAQNGDRLTTQDLFGLSVPYVTNNSVGAGTDVEINLRVDVEVQYGEFGRLTTQKGEYITTEALDYLLAGTGAPNGVRVFSGYILDYESLYGDKNGVTVTLASNGAELSQLIVKNTAGDISFVRSSSEIATTIKSVLDANPGRMTYDSNSIATTGVSIPTDVQLNSKLEVIEDQFNQTPAGFYWYGNVADNKVYLLPQSTSADHTWLLGHHIKTMALKRSQEQLRNKVYFVGAEDDTTGISILKEYNDAPSQSAWRVGLFRLTDRRYSVVGNMQRRAEKEMSRFKNPVYTTTVTISSAKYDLESIKLGQMVSIANADGQLLDVRLQIVSLKYTPTRATVQLGELLDTQYSILDDIESSLQNEQFQRLPNQPT